jgi:hypothetical protein
VQGQTNRVQSARKLAFSAYAEVRTALGEAKGREHPQNPHDLRKLTSLCLAFPKTLLIFATVKPSVRSMPPTPERHYCLP